MDEQYCGAREYQPLTFYGVREDSGSRHQCVPVEAEKWCPTCRSSNRTIEMAQPRISHCT